MQIREQGKQVQLIRSTYDKDKKRNVAKVVTHFPRYTDENPSADVWGVLTDEEKVQLQEWLDERAAKKAETDKNRSARIAPNIVGGLIPAADLMTPEVAAQVWEQLGKLQKALKKAGHKRPPLVKVAAEKQKDPRQMSIS